MALSDPTLALETPLAAAELGDAEALVREAGWNQTAADWRAFLELGTVYAVRNSAGRVIATAATLPYGDRFAWIAMVLVALDYRRQGLATRLLRRCIDDLMAAGQVPVLDATPAGRAVYRALGFEDAWSHSRLAAGARRPTIEAVASDAAVALGPITDAVWPALYAYDATVSGADRSAILARLRGRLPPAELFAERDGRVTGFLLGRDGRTATQLGPLIADDDATAQALLARALPSISGAVYMDLVDTKARTRRWLEAYGFATQRSFTRMLLERSEAFDDVRRTYATIGPEFG